MDGKNCAQREGKMASFLLPVSVCVKFFFGVKRKRNVFYLVFFGQRRFKDDRSLNDQKHRTARLSAFSAWGYRQRDSRLGSDSSWTSWKRRLTERVMNYVTF